MLPVVVGLILLVQGVYATAWGISRSSGLPTARYVLPGLLLVVFGVQVVLAPLVQDLRPLLATGAFLVGEVGLTYGVFRLLLTENRAERLLQVNPF